MSSSLSSWGHDFRPDYLTLANLKSTFPGRPLICLTATATDNVVRDVQRILRMDQSGPNACVVFKQSFNRANIHYEVRLKSAKRSKKDGSSGDNSVVSQIASWIQSHYPHESGIIYAHSKRECEEVTTDLAKLGLSVDFYHAGLDQLNRRRVQASWSADKTKIIVATIAFGMG